MAAGSNPAKSLTYGFITQLEECRSTKPMVAGSSPAEPSTYGSIAQVEEHRSSKPIVAGSIPVRPLILFLTFLGF